MDLFPPLPRESWAPTKETLHRFLQIVGKVRLAAVRRNHWWNVPFHLTGDGITTRPSGPLGDGTVFTVDFDFTTHRLRTLTLDGRQVSFPLTGLSVGDFYREFTGALQYLGIDVVPEHPYPLRPARRRPAVRRGRRTRHVRPGRREPLLDDPHPGDAGPGEVRLSTPGKPAPSTTSGTPSTSPSPGSPTGMWHKAGPSIP